MTMLFTVLVLLGFLFWFLEALPNSRIPGYVSRAFFLAAAILWTWPTMTGGA